MSLPARFGRDLTPAWLLFPLACALQIAAFSSARLDDAFITFRYGQNLALGHGMVFNPGERLMGSTSPGEVLLSALVYAVAGLASTPSVMAALGCVAWTAQAMAVKLLLDRVLGASGAWLVSAAVLVGAAGSSQWVALETNLAVALTLSAFVSANRGRYVLAAFLCGVAAVVRPDTLIVTSLLGMRALLVLRARVWRPALAFAAPVAPWLAFAAMSFGSVIPRSAKAKFQRTGFEEYALHMRDHLSSTLLEPLGMGTLWPVAFAAVLGGAYLLVKRERSTGWWLAYGALHIVAYLHLRTITLHAWHLYPAVLIALIAMLSGLVLAMQKLLVRHVSRPKHIDQTLLLLAALLAFLYGSRTLSLASGQEADYWTGARDKTYLQIASYLQPRIQPGDRFAAIEVGTLAYYTQLPAFDIGMLVTERKKPPPTPIRYVVLDPLFADLAPPFPPAGQGRSHGFSAALYEIPPGVSYFDIMHKKLAERRKQQQ
jgi:hypothetical protein